VENLDVTGRWRDAPRLATLRVGDARRRRAVAAVAVLVVLLGAVSAMTVLDDSNGGGAFPDRPDDAAPAPLGAPAAVGAAAASDAYAFIATQKGSSEPVTYDPCAPIHVVVDARTIVDRGMKLLDQALDKVSTASGLQFVVDGLTETEAPDDGTVVGPDRTWLPVTVSWSDPKTSPKLKGSVAGYAGSSTIERDGHRWFVTGTVVLDGPQLADILRDGGGRPAVRSVVMHELAHLVGLDHVDAAGQLMQPEGDEAITRWGAGDRVGLAALGRGRCIPY
jgi:hypothetical protein